MKLHIYNPEHDSCLAADEVHFVPSRVARNMQRQWGHLPAYWAEDGDVVAVLDAEEALRCLKTEGRRHAQVRFVSMDSLKSFTPQNMPSEIVPWGWDKHIAYVLTTLNPLFSPLLPSQDWLDDVRRMSSRVWVAREFLPRLMKRDDSWVCQMRVYEGSADELAKEVEQSPRVVLKAPWSNSGKGVRMVGGSPLTQNDRGWIANVLNEQGALVIEPRYDKLLDFAMEFVVERDYAVRYLGLSIFATKGGTYQGNLVLSEKDKLSIVERFVPDSVLLSVRSAIADVATQLFHERYTGPFGIDMLVLRTAEGTAINPCVELNLRHTMGMACM